MHVCMCIESVNLSVYGWAVQKHKMKYSEVGTDLFLIFDAVDEIQCHSHHFTYSGIHFPLPYLLLLEFYFHALCICVFIILALNILAFRLCFLNCYVRSKNRKQIEKKTFLEDLNADS